MSYDSSKHKILKYLDQPNKTLFWTNDEILIFLMPCLFGVWMGNLIVGVFIGSILQIFYKKLIAKFGAGAIATAQYWYLYQVNALKCTPPSYKREFIG